MDQYQAAEQEQSLTELVDDELSIETVIVDGKAYPVDENTKFEEELL